MKIGIVFGCFIPLHQGHEYLIDCAIKENDKIIIGVCGKILIEVNILFPLRIELL